MKCYNCKATIPDDASVCPTCGRQQGFDAKTIRAASKGDEAALTELYEKTYASVYNTIRFMVRDDDVALDILQDSYVKAFRSLDTLQDPSRFGAWMRRIAHNRAVDYLRQEKPVSLGSLTADESEDEVELVDDRPDSLPDVVLDQQETARLLGAILDELPDDQRVCVTMYYYEQLSVREIAQELEMPEATVKSRLMYGRKKIEQQVKALERHGVKLYGMAPAALLMWLFQAQEAQAAELATLGVLDAVLGKAALSSGATVAAQVQAVAGETAKAAAGKTATAAAATQAGAAAAGAGIGSKVVAAAVALAIVGGGAAVTSRMGEQPTTVALPADYFGVISNYLDASQGVPGAYYESYEEGRVGGHNGEVSYELLAQHYINGEDIWYGYPDVNGDGVAELALGTRTDDQTRTWDLFTLSDGEPIPLFMGGAVLTDQRHLYVTSDGILFVHNDNRPDGGYDEPFRIAEDGRGLIPAGPVDTDQACDPLSLDGVELFLLDGFDDPPSEALPPDMLEPTPPVPVPPLVPGTSAP